MNLGIRSKLSNILSMNSYGDYFVRSYRRRIVNPPYCKNKALKAANYVSYYTNREYEEGIENQLKNPVLKHARIETTNICNLNCIGCGTKATKRAKNFINLDNFKKAADALRSKGLDTVSLYTTGEPFLSKNIDELITYLFDTGFKKVKISSNGQYPDRMVATYEKFLGKLHDARFSIDAAHQNTYKNIRVGGDIELIKDTMRGLHKLNKGKKDFYFKISTKNLITKENLDEILDFYHVFGEWVNPENHIFALPNNMGLNEDFEDASSDYPSFIKMQRPCQSPAESVVINWDGGVSPCYTGRDFHGEIVVGNVYEKKLEDIWTGEEAKKLRDTFLKDENGKFKRDIKASCCKDCFTVYPFANDICNAYILFLYLSNPKMTGKEGGTRIRELLFDLHNAAIKKSNPMADEVVQKHFVI